MASCLLVPNNWLNWHYDKAPAHYFVVNINVVYSVHPIQGILNSPTLVKHYEKLLVKITNVLFFQVKHLTKTSKIICFGIQSIFETKIKVNWGLEGASDIMETPKLGVISILWMNFIITKTRVLGAGRTQSKIVFDPLRVLVFFNNKVQT